MPEAVRKICSVQVRFLSLSALIILAVCPKFTVAAPEETQPTAPNVIVILADDMGFSDLGCYGGEIETPNLDQLAAHGLRYTQFYNTARCWPTRAALMTGRYPHQVNMAMNFGLDAPDGYTGVVPQEARMIPEELAEVGYRCYHVGKWHLNSRGAQFNETWPLSRGYDHSYFMLRQDNFHNPKLLFDDKRKIERPGDTDPSYYVTSAYTEQALRRIREHGENHPDKPFFMYLAHTAPHFPLHALAEDVARFRGKYRAGWDELRKERHARQREMGLLNCELSERDPAAVAWDSLNEDEKDEWDARMATYAAMIYRIDVGVGQIVKLLQEQSMLENTLILFLSDNGSSAEYIVRGDGHQPGSAPGSRESYRCLEVGWSNAANTPFREHKMWTHEGGVSTPLIAHWPAGLGQSGSLCKDVGHVIDLMPTILKVAGHSDPQQTTNEDLGHLPGETLAALFPKEDVQRPDRTIFWEHQGHKAVREGDWKLVADRDQNWELYNLAEDRSELTDVSREHPQIVKRLATLWQKEAQQQNVLEWRSFPQSQNRHTPEYREK